MVHGAECDHPAGWNFTIRFDIHRDVFHLHLFLGVQDILRVWVHVVGVSHSGHRDSVCHHCMHVFPAER